MIDFPFTKYTNDELIHEYLFLIYKLRTISPTFPIQNLKTGMKCSNAFFQYERLRTAVGYKKSCYEYWKERRKKVLDYHYNKSPNQRNNLLHTISFLNHPPSQFPPFVAGQIYKYFGATKVLDCFSGWGDRMLGAMCLGIDYIGIDSNPYLKNYYNNMINFYPSKSKIKFINKKCEKVNINELDFDFVLSSPPHWLFKEDEKYWTYKADELIKEHYEGTEKDYETFLETCLVPVVKKCKKKNKNIWVCLHLPERMYKDLKKYIGPCRKKLKFKQTLNNKVAKKLRECNIYCF